MFSIQAKSVQKATGNGCFSLRNENPFLTVSVEDGIGIFLIFGITDLQPFHAEYFLPTFTLLLSQEAQK